MKPFEKFNTREASKVRGKTPAKVANPANLAPQISRLAELADLEPPKSSDSSCPSSADLKIQHTIEQFSDDQLAQAVALSFTPWIVQDQVNDAWFALTSLEKTLVLESEMTAARAIEPQTLLEWADWWRTWMLMIAKAKERSILYAEKYSNFNTARNQQVNIGEINV